MLSNLVLLPVLILAIGNVLVIGLRLAPHARRYSWLVAISIVVLCLASVIALGTDLPYSLPIANWQPRILLPISPTLALDQASWPFVALLVALCLAEILTGVIRPPETSRNLKVSPVEPRSWNNLPPVLLITAAGMLAVMAGNLLTLLLTWALLDLLETGLWMSKARTADETNSLVIALAIRLAGIGIGIWAGAVTYAAGQSLSLSPFSSSLGLPLIAAVGLRLGVVPFHQPLPRVDKTPIGLRTMLRLASTAAGLIVLVRAGGAPATVGGELYQTLLFLSGMTAAIAGLIWLVTPSPVEGLPYWIIGTAGLAAAAALSGQPAAAQAWGVILLAGGGLQGLANIRPKLVVVLLLVSIVAISGLPYTPTWGAAGLYAAPFQPFILLLLLDHALLMGGYIRHAFRRTTVPARPERWLWVIYLLGPLALLAMTITAGWWPAPGLIGPPLTRPGWVESAIGAAGLVLALAAAWLARGRRRQYPAWLIRTRPMLELDGLYRFAARLFQLGSGLAAFTSRILEGGAGILWALLMLALLLSIYIQLGLGGG